MPKPLASSKDIKDYAAAHSDRKWIQGMGWVYSVFGPGNLPDKKLVDEVVADRPYIWRRMMDTRRWPQ